MTLSIKKSNTLWLLCLVLFIYKNGMAQNIQEMSKAPAVAALNKYIDFPVDKSTGTLNVSIPIYSLKTNGFELPISLSYHTGGIKVSEMAASIGLGWAINAGGVISRSIKSMPDEVYYTEHGFSQIKVPATSPPFFLIGNRDLEPDIFYFNINGYSGRFTMDKYHRIHLIPEQDIKIKLDTTVNSIETFAKWILTTPDGNQYNFEGVYDHGKTNDGNFEARYDAANYINAWHLSSIVTVASDTINFQYQMDSYRNRINVGSSSMVTANSNPCANPQTLTADNWVSGNALRRISSKNVEIWFNNSQTLREDVQADLNYSRALDNIEIKDISTGTLIKKIKLLTSYFQSNDNLAFSPMPMVGNNVAYTVPDYLQKRLRLDGLQEYSGDGIPLPAYKFSYNKNNLSDLFPNRLSNAQDHWGYYNGKSQNKSLIGKYTFNLHDCTMYLADRNVSEKYKRAYILDNIVFPTGGVTKIFYDSLTTISNYPGVRVKKIQNISGETSTITEKSFLYSGWHITGGPPIYAQRPIFNMDKIVKIGDSDRDLSIKIAAENAGSVYTYDYVSFVPNVGDVYEIYLATSNPINYSGEFAGSNAYYDQVIEIQKDNGSIESNYSAEEIDEYISDVEIYPLLFKRPALKAGKLISEIIKREDGQILKSTYFTYAHYYREIIHSPDAVRMFSTTGFSTLTFYNLYTGFAYLTKKEEIEYDSSRENKITTVYSYDGIPTSLKDLNWASNIHVYRDAPNHHMLSLVSRSQSDGSFANERFRYVADFVNQLHGTTASSNLDGQSRGIKQAIDFGSTNLPVEQISTINRNGIESVVASKIYEYEISSSILGKSLLNLKKELNLELSEPINYNNFSTSIEQSGNSFSFIKNSNYNPIIIYDSYGSKNNLTQYHFINKPNNSIIWRYNNSVPIAQVTNAASSEIYYDGFEESSAQHVVNNTLLSHTGDKYYNSTSLSINWLRPNIRKYILAYWYYNGIKWKYTEQNYLGPLILDSGNAYDDVCIYPADAQFKFSNQKPSIGVSSITDVRGQTNFYEYDGFNRLSSIKDDSKDILKAFEYHYNEVNDGYSSAQVSAAFQKNNCLNQSVGSSVTYLVPFGRYKSPFSQKEADDMAKKDLAENGQAYANKTGECIGGTELYYNEAIVKVFTPICSTGQTGDESEYIVDAGEFSSTISQRDANDKAWAKLMSEGQAQANQTCRNTNALEWESYVSDYNTKVTSIKFYNPSTNSLLFELNTSQLVNMYTTHNVNGGNYNIVVQVQGGYYDDNTGAGYKSIKMQVYSGATTLQQVCFSHSGNGNNSNYTFYNVNLVNLSNIRFNILNSICTN